MNTFVWNYMSRLAFFVLVALIAVPAASAGPVERRDARVARAGLSQAVAGGSLPQAEAARYRKTLSRVLRLVDRLPAERARPLAAVLHQIAAQSPRYDAPRALTLFAMLELNADHLARRALPQPGRDVLGPDGVVYRHFAGQALQFHPLANVMLLNAHIRDGRDEDAAALAEALAARAVARSGGAAVWEYPFRYYNVAPGWASGMAQAVGAQALARAGARFGDPALFRAAAAAARSVPRLTMGLPEGPWVRLYETLALVVLNAQLQSVISLGDYAELTGDPAAAELAVRMRSAAAALLPRFDTGSWSWYSLRNESPLSYQRYVVEMLRRLARDTGEPLWADTARRFVEYEKQPPRLRAGGAPGAVYPRAKGDRHGRTGFRVWVSKISDVTLFVDGKWRRSVRLRGGWNTLRWTPPAQLRLGQLPVRIAARGLAGNRAELELGALEVRRDVSAPRMRATVGRTRIYWRATDDASERLHLRLRLARAGTRRAIDLGSRPLNGFWTIGVPSGRWWATLEARDASGNIARVPLGRVA
jgi:hypothetical protein